MRRSERSRDDDDDNDDNNIDDDDDDNDEDDDDDDDDDDVDDGRALSTPWFFPFLPLRAPRGRLTICCRASHRRAHPAHTRASRVNSQYYDEVLRTMWIVSISTAYLTYSGVGRRSECAPPSLLLLLLLPPPL